MTTTLSTVSPILVNNIKNFRWETYTPREISRYPLHAILQALQDMQPELGCAWYQQALSEWPHISHSQPEMIAYTKTVEKGVADKQSLMKPGAYIAQLCPSLQGHEIEKIVVHYRTGNNISYRLINDIPAEIDIMVSNGKDIDSSCMTNTEGKDYWTCENHPYLVYAPGYGWQLAVGMRGPVMISRALVNGMQWVRAFGVAEDDRTSLVAWLDRQGYNKTAGWEGHQISIIRQGNRTIGPYLDGTAQCSDDDGYIVEEDRNEDQYNCTNTNGTIKYIEAEEKVECIDGDYEVEEDCVYLAYINESEGTRVRGYALMHDCTRINEVWYLDEHIVWSEYISGYILVWDAQKLEDSTWVRAEDAQELEDGTWIKAEDAQELEDGTWIASEDAQELEDGTWVRAEDAQELEDGTWIKISIPNLAESWIPEIAEEAQREVVNAWSF